MIYASTTNSIMYSSSSGTNNYNAGGGGGGLKTYLKTPEGRYKLKCEKSHPAGFLHGKSLTQVTLAHLKDKPAIANSLPSSSSSSSSSSPSSSSSSSSLGVRTAAAKFLGGGNGSRTKLGLSSATSNINSYTTNSNIDKKGTYLVYNVGDAIFITDLSSQDKDPIKSIYFTTSNPTSHAFDPDARNGHDLLIGLNCGDVYSVSLRLQLQDVGKKLVGAQHYNKDGCMNNRRCTSMAWVPNGNGTFVVAHADGNMYVYEKNPVARWHICQGSISSVAFSDDGVYLATVGRDGYLRVFDFKSQQLICGGKSYYGALLCCSWSMDGKYILTGGEDDLVQIWSMEERKIVAWGEGHTSWVSGVAFDSYWSTPNTDGTGENVVYRFGSVGQDTQLLLWDLEIDELVVPLRRGAPGGSPTAGTHSAHWDPVGTLQPAPSIRDVPMVSPLVVQRVETEPLSGLIFTQESILTACREGHIKVWMRPSSDSISDGSKQ